MAAVETVTGTRARIMLFPVVHSEHSYSLENAGGTVAGQSWGVFFFSRWQSTPTPLTKVWASLSQRPGEKRSVGLGFKSPHNV